MIRVMVSSGLGLGIEFGFSFLKHSQKNNIAAGDT